MRLPIKTTATGIKNLEKIKCIQIIKCVKVLAPFAENKVRFARA